MNGNGFRSLVCVGLLLASTAASAAEAVVTIRLVKASNTGEGIDRGIEDVAAMLRQCLVFKSYTLQQTATVRLPVQEGVVDMGGYRIFLTGGAGKLDVAIRRNRRPLLNTTLTIQPGKPVVLGGFPERDGRMIFVFSL